MVNHLQDLRVRMERSSYILRECYVGDSSLHSDVDTIRNEINNS